MVSQFQMREGQMVRWQKNLQTYEFVAKNQIGSSHETTDSLSKTPCLKRNYTFCEHQEENIGKVLQIVLTQDRDKTQIRLKRENLIRYQKLEWDLIILL